MTPSLDRLRAISDAANKRNPGQWVEARLIPAMIKGRPAWVASIWKIGNKVESCLGAGEAETRPEDALHDAIVETLGGRHGTAFDNHRKEGAPMEPAGKSRTPGPRRCGGRAKSSNARTQSSRATAAAVVDLLGSAGMTIPQAVAAIRESLDDILTVHTGEGFAPRQLELTAQGAA